MNLFFKRKVIFKMDIFIFFSAIPLENLWESFVGKRHWPLTKMFEIIQNPHCFCLKDLQFKCSPFEVYLHDDIVSWQMQRPYVARENVAFNEKADPASG